MKYRSFAVTYTDEASRVNRENYLLNGFCKENPREAVQSDSDFTCDNRILYAVTSGHRSEAAGEDAAYICVDLLRDFLNTDFCITNKEYFELANERVLGRIFQNNGKRLAADIAVLYINKKRAVVYNLGDVDVFFCCNDSIKKISGKPPETVEVQKETLDDEGNFEIYTEIRKTAKFLGTSAEECEIRPFVSEKIRIKDKAFFLICSKGVADNIDKGELKEILFDNCLTCDEKTTKIIDKVSEKKPDGNYTTELIQCSRGINFRGTGFRAFIVALLFVLFGTGLLCFRGEFCSKVIDVYNKCKNMVETYVENNHGDVVLEPWVPMRSDEQQEEKPEAAAEAPAESESSTENEMPASTEQPETQPTPAPQSSGANTQQSSRPNPVVRNPVTQMQAPAPPAAVSQNPPNAVTAPVTEPTVPSGNAAAGQGTVERGDVELPIDFGN